MPPTNFRSSYPLGLHIKFGFDWRAVSEKMFEHCEKRWMEDGQKDVQTDAIVYYKLLGSGELKVRTRDNFYDSYFPF